MASKYCPGAQEPGPSGLTAHELMRMGKVGETDVMVVFCNPLMATQSDRLVFFTALDDHFGVPQSDLTRDTWVETNDGRRTEGGFAWDGGDLLIEDHHTAGILTGPLTTPDEIGLIGPDTASIALHLQGIGSSGQCPVFEWQLR